VALEALNGQKTAQQIVAEYERRFLLSIPAGHKLPRCIQKIPHA